MGAEEVGTHHVQNHVRFSLQRLNVLWRFSSVISKTKQLALDLQKGLLFSFQMSARTPGVPSQKCSDGEHHGDSI